VTTFINLLTAGDTLDFGTVVDTYKASAGWTLKYRLAPRVSGAVIDITAIADGDDYRVQATAATTAAWAAGFYSWAAFVEKAAERYTVGRGSLEIRVSSVAMPAGFDDRGHAQKVLDAIEAVIANRATKDQEEYSIEGRSLKRTPIPDLLVMRDKYKGEVMRLQAGERVGAGLPNPNRVGVRFSRI
jgi:hypothetical protein